MDHRPNVKDTTYLSGGNYILIKFDIWLNVALIISSYFSQEEKRKRKAVIFTPI